jgi:hypothetical protein
MKFSLRSLMIVVLVLPPLLATAYFAVQRLLETLPDANPTSGYRGIIF